MRKVRAGAARAKERANMSFFIFVMFFAVFGVIVLTELLMLERASSGAGASGLRARLVDDIQVWAEGGGGGGGRTQTARGGRDAPPATPPPAREPRDAVWQPVSRTRFKFFVYSAYVERRTGPAVRIIAATRTRGSGQFWCRLSLADNRTLTVPARVKPIRENWNLKYSACFVLCGLQEPGASADQLVGASVSVVAGSQDEPTNMLKVVDTKPEAGNEVELRYNTTQMIPTTNLVTPNMSVIMNNIQDLHDTLHVCVKPFHFSYFRALWLLEWLELHLELGVGHFLMYEESLSASVRCLLKHYRQRGLLTLLPWKLDLLSKVEIRNQGQFAAFNDCLYRSMSAAGWLIVIDVDEVILPRRERTLPVLLSILRSSKPSRAPAALLFRNAFFYTRWEDDAAAGGSSLLTQRKTRRWAVPHAVKNRSKYAVRPAEVVELGNHFVWEFAPGGIAYGVQPERALLHHYRMQCEFDGNECLKVAAVTDRTAHRWGEELEGRVNLTHRALRAECALPPRNTPAPLPSARPEPP